MLTRRRLMNGAALAAAAGALAPRAWAEQTAPGADLCRHVDPFIGTGGHGHTYPGATVPFGMIQLSPDTDNARWDACSGYHHDDTSILGFSHTHLSGTGVGDMMDVLVVPRTGPVRLAPGSLEHPENSYRSRFDHADEQASPGYYRVLLKDSGVVAELTATARAGLHRYHFPEGDAHLLIDLAHGCQDNPGVKTRVTEASLKLVGDDTLVGGRRVHQWADGREIYFALKLSRPIARAELFSNDRPLADGAREIQGAKLKAALHIVGAHTEPLLVKVGLSGVDIDGALRNLEAEIPGWDFEGVRTAARNAWERELGRIVIQGGQDADRRIFYTGLYHSLVAPSLFSDVDGRYRGMDTAVHQLPAGANNYSTYSLWDTYRALHPLLTLIAPERNADLAQGLVRMAEESPAGPPVWPLQGIETFCMVGWHSAVVLAEACATGLPGVDYARAWPIFRKRAFEDDVAGLAYYRQLGFIPSDKIEEAVSKTLEYAYDDWAMARLADAAGAHDDAKALRERSRNYRNLFDAKAGFMRPRLADGTWAEPFDPRAMGHNSAVWRDFTECNAWQATFLNQHDLYGYMPLFGGEKAFEAKLDELFTTSSELPPDAPPDIAGLVGQYAHGNEPSHHIAYLYAYTGAHHKTQARVRMLLKTMHKAAPDGLAGNEDCGQMSAWYVISALGLYAVDPVSGNYVFGSPLFDKAEVSVAPGRTLTIEAHDNGPDHPYIQSVRWNGKPYSKSWISHAELTKGGRLVFEMGPKPNLAFGSAPADRPPSFA